MLQRKTLAGAKYDRRLSAASVASSRLMVERSPIRPAMNLRLPLSRLFANRWIFFSSISARPPDLVRTRVAPASVGSAPGPQIASHRPDRNLHIEFPRQQLLYCFSGPQGERQAQLIGAAAEDHAHRGGGLMGRQSRYGGRPRRRLSAPGACAFHKPHPAAYRTSRHGETPAASVCERPF